MFGIGGYKGPLPPQIFPGDKSDVLYSRLGSARGLADIERRRVDVDSDVNSLTFHIDR